MLPCDRQAMFLLTIWLEVTLFSTFSSFEKLVEQGLEVKTTACTAINIKTSKQAPETTKLQSREDQRHSSADTQNWELFAEQNKVDRK